MDSVSCIDMFVHKYAHVYVCNDHNKSKRGYQFKSGGTCVELKAEYLGEAKGRTEKEKSKVILF